MSKEKRKNDTELLSERVNALEVALLMVLNSLRNNKSFKIDGDVFNVLGKIPEKTLEIVENIIVNK